MMWKTSLGRLVGGRSRTGYVFPCFDSWNSSSLPPSFSIGGQKRNTGTQKEPTENPVLFKINPGKTLKQAGFSDFPEARPGLSLREVHETDGTRRYVYDKLAVTKGGSSSDALMLMATNTNMGNELEKQKTKQEEELITIDNGDKINLCDLLFTKNRDYLVKYNGEQVKADQLAGKVVVIYFVALSLEYMYVERHNTTLLMDIYNYLPPNKGFEVVFVAVDENDPTSFNGKSRSITTNPQKYYEDIFSRMPWTAIPFSDIESRQRLAKIFKLSSSLFENTSVSIDSTGVVLRCVEILFDFGALGYPFSMERTNFLESLYYAPSKQLSLKLLLASPERNYVISNRGDKVPIHTLEDKVIAFYFYEDGRTDDRLTEELRMVYEELAKNKKNFEVVLLYLYDTKDTEEWVNEESFWKKIKTMPWLALPFKDPHHKIMKYIFDYPEDKDEFMDVGNLVPTLLIYGPHGEFVEPCGADILMNYKIPAYPFTCEKVLKLETERVRELKLQMLWEPYMLFRRKDGFQVQLSQLAGKRIILLFEFFSEYDFKFLKALKERYLHMKGTDDEFEVIHVYLPSYCKHDIDLPWFVYPLDEVYSNASDGVVRKRDVVCHYTFPWYSISLDEGYIHACELLPSFARKRYVMRGRLIDFGASQLFAFDRDGRLVRETSYPSIVHMNFPFYAGGLEKETLRQLEYVFNWDCWLKTPIYSSDKARPLKHIPETLY